MANRRYLTEDREYNDDRRRAYLTDKMSGIYRDFYIHVEKLPMMLRERLAGHVNEDGYVWASRGFMSFYMTLLANRICQNNRLALLTDKVNQNNLSNKILIEGLAPAGQRAREQKMKRGMMYQIIMDDIKIAPDTRMETIVQYKKDRISQSDKLNPEQKQVRLMKELQEALYLPTLPMQIECFDNSNISGTDAVAGCVVFKKCRPSKQDYRKYIIKTVSGPDDYASMQEVVRRRYSRMIEEEKPLPDLIITDGGRGQMEVVRQVVEDELQLSIPIAGLAKDDKHRTNELLFGFPPQTIAMKTDSPLFRLLTQIQDEVHRYAITFHRDKRSKHQIASILDNVPGIGPKTKTLLLNRFHSVKRIREAEEDELAAVIGASKAKVLKEFLADADKKS